MYVRCLYKVEIFSKIVKTIKWGKKYQLCRLRKKDTILLKYKTGSRKGLGVVRKGV